MRVWQRFATNPAANSDLQLRKGLEMATIRLCAQHEQQLNELQLGRHARLVKGRKNLGLVIAVVNWLITTGKTETATRDVADALVEVGLDTHWDRNPDAKDGTGLVKSVGDCLGNHRDALRLERVRVNKLPGVRLPASLIDDDYLRGIGIDPNTCPHKAVTVQLAAGEPDIKGEPTDTESELEPVSESGDVLDDLEPESELEPDLDPTLDALISQRDDPEMDAAYYRD
jgi:hypothetical protein